MVGGPDGPVDTVLAEALAIVRISGSGDGYGDEDALRALMARASAISAASTAPAPKLIHLDCAPGPLPATRPGRTLLRLGIPYGPGLRDSASVHALVARALLREPMTADATAPGPLQLIHVWDVATAIEAVMEADEPAAVYDVCDDQAVTVPELARLVARNTVPVPVTVTGTAPLGPQRPPLLSAARIRAELGWRPSYPLAQGLKTVAQWLAYEAEQTWK
jgi:hypothetical protein